MEDFSELHLSSSCSTLVKLFAPKEGSFLDHGSETNAIAELAARRVKEGTSAILLQSSLDEKRSSDSTECQCYLRNVQDFLSDGKTLCKRRFGEPFSGTIPSRSLVEFHPISAKDQNRLHQFGLERSYQASSFDMCMREAFGKEIY